MLVLRDNDVNSLYRKLLHEILAHGETVRPRGMKTRECRGALLVLTNPYANVVVSPLRRPNYHFMVAEFLWMLLGQNDAESIGRFNKQIGSFSDDGVYFDGAYGPQIVEQMSYVLKALRNDPESRQAVMTIWRQRPGPSKDVPCTSLFQFQLRDGGLEMDTYMRSNDAWLGFPYDLFNFTRVQAYVAAQLGVGASVYRHHVGSMHLYEQHFAKAGQVVDDHVRYPVEESPAFPGGAVPPIVRAYFNEIAGFNGDGLDAGELSIRVAATPEPWRNYLRLLLSRVNKGFVAPGPWYGYQQLGSTEGK